MRSIAIRLLLVSAFIVPAFAQTQIDLDTRTQGSRLPFFGTDTGTASAYAVATVAPVTVLRTGSTFIFKAVNASTGASTLTVTGFSSHAIKKNGATAIAAGDIGANQVVEVVYDGTNYQLIGPGVVAATPPGGSTGDLQYNNAGAFGAFADGTIDQVLHGTKTFKSIPSCLDTSGNHLNYNTSTHAWSCGTSSSTTAGGSNTNLQYNNSGALGGFADGTSHQVLHGGRTFGAVDLASADVTGALPNANLANQSVTVNGTTCTLGSTCNPSGGGTGTSNGLKVLFDSGTVTDTLTAAGNFATTCTLSSSTLTYGSGVIVKAEGTEHIVGGDNHQFGTIMDASTWEGDVGHSSATGDFSWSVKSSFIVSAPGASGFALAGFTTAGVTSDYVWQQNNGSAGSGMVQFAAGQVSFDTTSSHTFKIHLGGTVGASSNAVLKRLTCSQVD